MTVDWLRPGTTEDVVDALLGEFRTRFGRTPVAVHAAPGRVNLIGEHLDYNGGLCLPLALPHRTFVASASREDDVVRVASRQQDTGWEGTLGGIGPAEVDGWAAYAVGVIWALREAGLDVPGCDVLVDGRVPLGAGLSSSAALECAVAMAVTEAAGLPTDPAARQQLVEACVRAEREVAGAPTGGMDQSAALLAEEGALLLLDFAARTTEEGGRPGLPRVTQVPLPDTEHRLLVIDTRVQHALTDGQYGNRREECEQAAKELGVRLLAEAEYLDAALDRLSTPTLRARVRHVITEQERTREAVDAVLHGNWPTLGLLMDASHASLRDDYEVSCVELDVAVDAAREAGAVGARMTGGGFGGSAIALVTAEQVDRVVSAVVEAFRTWGWRAPGFLLATPSRGAERVR